MTIEERKQRILAKIAEMKAEGADMKNALTILEVKPDENIKNKNFWLAIIPAVLLLVQTIAAVFGYSLNFGELGNQLIAVVNAVFALLVILGVVNDPTTAGISDSKLARTYSSPKED